MVWDDNVFTCKEAVGDDLFIAIKGEWKGVQGDIVVESDEFNDFIKNADLMEIPLGGRKFTRIIDDGLKFSKLDRFLVTSDLNQKWDNLAAIALDRKESDHCPLILKDALVIEEEGPTWMTELVNYLKEGILPGDEKEARKLRLKAPYVMREIHEGSCSMHAGPLSVVAKAIRLGYFWPTMHKDARDMIRKCNDCQIHRLVPRHPQQPLTPITAPCPFYKWGINIAGPFPEGPGKVKFLIVAMDYFTKWIEVKAVATITGGQVKKFVWDNIVCRFGIPGEIISDNGKRFADNPFKDWCDKLKITQRFASVKHPQSNGLVERANRSLWEGIKARLGEGNKNWVEELPHVLWAYRIMIKSSHDDTPFSLTHGTEAVIPAEIKMPIYRTTAVDVVNNDKELRLNLDLLEERREIAAMSEAKSKSKMMKYYNSRVRGVAFKPGDFVYRSNDASHADEVIVSHLQYADDTIFFGEWSRENACKLMYILKCFEEVSGLGVNLKKSCLYGIGVEGERVEAMARFMKCSVGESPFTFLGLPVGTNMRRIGARGGDEKLCKVIRSVHGIDGALGRGAGIKSQGGEKERRMYWCREGVIGLKGNGDGYGIGVEIRGVGERVNGDTWKWKLSDDGDFTTKELTAIIQDQSCIERQSNLETLWNRLVPKKINMFVWRARKERLP
nr:reverse transcriptase domain-containing protein [Tanacetum cinerariifolium]